MVNPGMENKPYPEQYIPLPYYQEDPPWGMVPRNMLYFRSDTVLLEVFFPITKVVLFIQKLTEILENSEECRGTYELVPISGNDPHEISNVLVGMHNAANIEMHNPEANGVHWPEQGQL